MREPCFRLTPNQTISDGFYKAPATFNLQLFPLRPASPAKSEISGQFPFRVFRVFAVNISRLGVPCASVVKMSGFLSV